MSEKHPRCQVAAKEEKVLEKEAPSVVSRARHGGVKQGARKDGRGNEPVGSCAICDARSTGPRTLEGKNR